jgi:hypothetical protein
VPLTVTINRQGLREYAATMPAPADGRWVAFMMMYVPVAGCDGWRAKGNGGQGRERQEGKGGNKIGGERQMK